MNGRNKRIMPNGAYPFSSVGKPAGGPRRLRFEAIERRMLLSAAGIEMPALRQEYVTESVVVPLVAEAYPQTDLPLDDRPAIVVDLYGKGSLLPELRASEGFRFDYPVVGSFESHWEALLDGGFQGELGGERPWDAPVESAWDFIVVRRPVDSVEFDNEGFIDLSSLGFFGNTEGSPNAGLPPRLPDCSPRTVLDTSSILGQDYDLMGLTGENAWDVASEERLATSTTVAKLQWTAQMNGLEPHFQGGPRLWDGIVWRPEDLEVEITAGTSLGMAYTVVIDRAAGLWHVGSAGEAFLPPPVEAWLSSSWGVGGGPSGSLDLFAPPPPGGAAPFDWASVSPEAIGFTEAVRISDQSLLEHEETDVYHIRIVEGDADERMFGSVTEFGGDIASDAAVEVPVLVAEHPTGLALTRAWGISGTAEEDATSSGGFIDVGLLAIAEVKTGAAGTAGSSTDSIPEGKAGQNEYAMEGSGETVAAWNETAPVDMETLLSITPEAGVIIEANLIPTKPAVSVPAGTLGTAHDAVLAEMAEAPREQAATLAHFWAPAAFAVSALGRQAWKRKIRSGDERHLGPKAGRAVLPPTVGFRVDEETDKAS